MTTIADLKIEITAAAQTFWSADAGVRETFYTKAAASVLSEADARALTASGSFKFTTVEGDELTILPKEPQRKNDGDRGPQMNFWLKFGGNLYAKFNIHVDVVSLEKEYKISIAAAQEKGWELQPKELERQANAAARAKRQLEGWADFAKKPG